MTKFRKSIAIVYHSPFGHTQKVAEHIAIGAQKLNIEVLLINVTDVNWELSCLIKLNLLYLAVLLIWEV